MKYKVGDKVRIKSLDWYNENEDETGHIHFCYAMFMPEMSRYCSEIVTIEQVVEEFKYYLISRCRFAWTDEMIEGLVEEETKPNIIEEAKTYWDSIKDAWICPEGYIFKDENGNVINATKIVLEKKKKEYPKTYEKCCKVMNYCCNPAAVKTTHKEELIRKFQFLLLYRDSYWKIAGDEMGLGKPWEPNWEVETSKYIILCKGGEIQRHITCKHSRVLAFPTEEMRDAFYENFKELIEFVKELL